MVPVLVCGKSMEGSRAILGASITCSTSSNEAPRNAEMTHTARNMQAGT